MLIIEVNFEVKRTSFNWKITKIQKLLRMVPHQKENSSKREAFGQFF
jgi:hypothetical protein